jgi:hypothetical protein
MSKIISHIKTVISILEKEENASKGFNAMVKLKELDPVASFFGVTKREAIVFCALYYLSLTKNNVSPSDVANFISGSPYDMPKVVSQLDKLQKNKLIISRGNAKFDNCKVSIDLMLKLEKNQKPLVQKTGVKIDLFEILDRLEDIYSYRFDDMISVGEFYEEFDKIYEEQTECTLFSFLQRKKIHMKEWPMFIYGFLRQVKMDDHGSVEYGIRSLYRDYSLRFEIKKKFMEENADVFRKGVVEYPGKDLKSKDKFVVRDEALREILGDKYEVLMTNLSASKSMEGALLPEQIMARPLFYNKKEKEAVEILDTLLSAERYPLIVNGLKENGMRHGVCVLLHGSPGTGKTESVLQIAKSSGRPIMKVDFSQIKDKFVGESEKRLKAVFDRYADYAKGNDMTPILLLNEADALLSRRIHVTSSVDQMNNAMQNILLEEMENFEGILIATTNLIPNLDNAFERRFLYKVEFTQPEASVRKEIWRGHFSWMEEAVLEDLSNRFNFSGGQIENIARKAKMNELLFLRRVNVPELIEMCEAELLTPAKRSMGFKAE